MSSDFDFGGAVPPWGRSAAEYEAFFALSDVAPSARILDCGGGPSSFVAEWSRNGRYVVAVDPIYRFSARDFLADFDSTAAQMLAECGRRETGSSGITTAARKMSSNTGMTSSQPSLPIFRQQLGSGRYVSACLPELPFLSESFDLVLCSHLLFLYSAEFDSEMHLSFLREMLRIGREVRVFPLLDMDGKPSAHLENTIQALRVSTHVELVPLSFEFRSGDSKMLRLTH